MSQKIKTSVEIDGSLSASQIANATTDTDKFLVSDNGTVKYRTGAEMLSDLGVSQGTASRIQHQVKAGVAINKGQAVYVTSADGTNMIVGLASNTSESTSSKTMGLLNATVSTNGFADVITEGLLSGLDTSTAVVGNPVWLGTGGNLIYGLANKPYAPSHLVFIGIVTRVNANNGEIFVKVQNGFELDELHDVDLKTITPINGHLLGFNGTLWVNKTIAGWLGYTPQAQLNGTGFVKASGTTITYDNTSYYPASNPSGYISTYTETDTLASVTGRGNTTTSNIFANGVRIGRTFSLANRATVRLDSNGDFPADVLFGRDVNYADSSWNGVFWSLSSRGSNESNSFRLYRGIANTGTSELVVLDVSTGGSISASGDFRAPIFYDSNNTSYYVDPASTSNLNALTLAGAFSAPGYNKTNWDTAYSWGNHASAGYATSGHTHDLMRHSLRAPNNVDSLTSSNFRDQLFGTSSNGWAMSTARWNSVPSGLSGMNMYGTMFAWAGSDTHGFIATDHSTANIQVGGGSGNSITWRATLIHSSNIGSYALTSYTETDTLATVTGRGATTSTRATLNGGWTVPDATMNYVGNFSTNDYSTMRFMSRAWADVQGANGLAYTFNTHTNGGSGGYGALQIYYGESGYVYAPTSFRAPIFYDTNDTGFYLDPASTSNLNAVNFSTLYSNRSGASGNVITIDNAGSSTWPFIFQTSAVGNDNASGFWTSSLGYPDMRLRKDDGTVRALISSWERSYTTYGLSDETDMRAPIFYDSNDTTYYLDLANSTTSAVLNSKIIGKYIYRRETGGNNPVKTYEGVLATRSDNGAPYTYYVIETNVPQDDLQMGGFYIDLFGDYSATSKKTTIGIAGYWNPESNGGFIGFEATSTNPNVTPTLQVSRKNSTGKTCFIITVSGPNYPVIVARDLYLGYTANDSTSSGYGDGWSIIGTGDISGYSNNDSVVWNTSPTRTGGNASGTWGINITGSAGSAPNGSNINNYYDTTAGDGYGFRFWNGSDSYKISMGYNPSLYQYGPVSDYSIKMQMNDSNTGRGFTWGRLSYAPIAALNSTSGDMQIAGGFTAASSSRAPIFYDSDNTGYYWNPNTSSGHRFQTPSGYIDIGPMNGSWSHFETDRPSFYFGKSVHVNGSFTIYGNSSYLDSGRIQAPIFYASDDTSYYLDPNSTSNIDRLMVGGGITDPTYTRISTPGGGSYVTTASTVNGAIRILLPTQGSAMMMTCTIKVYEYSTNKSFTITVGGHRDSANWYNEFCYMDGGENRGELTVRFGVDSGKDCIYIGVNKTYN
jgi:hypothetical protein